MWNYKTPGIPDDFFERTEKVPITKEEVRTIQISKARLTPGQTVFDIGCGSGSISIEAAIQVENSGKVIAVDYDSNAIELTKKNIKKFEVSNVSVILGNVGIPPGGIVLILGVDRILDMCRTVINVTGDLTAALIMDRWK